MEKIFTNYKVFFLLIIVILLSGINPVKAQVASTWSAGLEVGPGFARYDGDAENHDFKAGIIAGGFLTYSVVNTFGITGKALFSQKGSRFSDKGTRVKQTLDYLEVPIVGRFFLNREGRFRPNIFVGPSFGFLLGVKNKRGNGENVKIPADERDNISEFDVGMTGGLGLNYEILNETRILIDARYTHGLSDIIDPGEFNNRGIGVTIGMSFGL